MKNLARVESRTEKRAAGATAKLTKAEIKGKVLEYSWYMKKQGYPESTIVERARLLRRMIKHGANLWDPEKVKEFIAAQDTWGDGYKANAVCAYSTFLEMEGLTWEPPRYKRPDRVPFVPLESELDQLINGCGKTVSIFLQGLKETGADPGELWRVEWTDINEKAKTITINHPVKRHNARILPISRELIERFNLLPKKSKRIFPMLQSSLYNNFWYQRKRIAQDFNNPRLLKITFTTFRHWKATYEYHRTKDILHVKRLLGHKKLSSTMIYIDIEKAIYGEHENDDFISQGTTSDKGARALIEAGFEYICTSPNGTMLFRKRK